MTPIYYDGGQNIARFSIDVSPELKLTGFRLRRRRDGGHTIAAPAAFGVRVAHFALDTFRALTADAVAEFGRLGAPHARN
ncbi:hypothetical protein ASE63_06670 [Bosea sp. Root381]|uniref:hypothetical protein n=1 Tax=Bosea sp. Root381 TaxID=1736524 RepID=UPI0006F6A44F|nr:hypothetical protein [Bosea sp. Root381]KRE05978.1 hypothetical protein ASE63_06670 [Bosea sp. Root381]